MTETEQQDADVLCENWEHMRHVIAAVQQKTGLSRVEVMILWAASGNDEPLEPWQQTT